MKWTPLWFGIILSANLALAQQRAEITFDKVCERHDSNGDKLITKDEFMGKQALFTRFDENKDGCVTKAEFDTFRKRMTTAGGTRQNQASQRTPSESVTKHPN